MKLEGKSVVVTVASSVIFSILRVAPPVPPLKHCRD